MRVGEIICRSEQVLFKNLPSGFHSIEPSFGQAFIRSRLIPSAAAAYFQIVIAAPSTVCTRRAKNKKVNNQTVFKPYSKLPGRRLSGEYAADASKIGHLQLLIVKLEKTASPIEHFESGVASSR
jgi:hypothetical protein